MQWRIERADGDREAVHGAEHTDEVIALHGQQLLQRGATVFLVVGENHRPHVRKLLFAKKHVFSAAQPDAFCAECARLNGVAGNIGVGANSHSAERFCPTHEFLE